MTAEPKIIWVDFILWNDKEDRIGQGRVIATAEPDESDIDLLRASLLQDHPDVATMEMWLRRI